MPIDFSQYSFSTPTPTSTEDEGIDFSKYTLGQPKRTIGGTLKDIAGTALNAAISVPEAAVGLADIPTLGRAGKAAESLGFKPKEAKQFIEENLTSPAQRYADSQVQSADGFIPTLQAGLENPSTIVKSVAQSIPLMLAGGAVAKGLGAAAGLAGEAAVKAAPLLAGAGEGAMMGGAQAENIRQQTDDGYLTPKQAGLALGTGVLGAGIGMAGNKLGNQLGLTQLDTLAAGGEMQAAKMGMAKRVIGGGAVEGLAEEAPQSAIEKMAENEALNRPLMQGVGSAAASGVLAGGLMGMGGGVLHKPQVDQQVPPPVDPAAQVPPVEPAPANQWEQPQFQINPNADAMVQNRTVPAKPLQQAIDGQYPQANYNPLAGTWEQPTANNVKDGSVYFGDDESRNYALNKQAELAANPIPTTEQTAQAQQSYFTQAPVRKPNSPISNALSAGMPDLAARAAINPIEPPVVAEKLRVDRFGNQIRETATPEALAARDEFGKTFDQPAAQPEQPYKRAPINDDRITNYGGALQSMANDLQAGGGIVQMPDGTRTPSVNTNLEWFDGLREVIPNLSLNGIKKAVDNAINGKSLGQNEAMIVTAMLDYASEQSPVSTTPETLDDAIAQASTIEQEPDAPRTPEDDLRDALERVKPYVDEDTHYELGMDETLPIEQRINFLNNYADNYERENNRQATDSELQTQNATTPQTNNATNDVLSDANRTDSNGDNSTNQLGTKNDFDNSMVQNGDGRTDTARNESATTNDETRPVSLQSPNQETQVQTLNEQGNSIADVPTSSQTTTAAESQNQSEPDSGNQELDNGDNTQRSISNQASLPEDTQVTNVEHTSLPETQNLSSITDENKTDSVATQSEETTSTIPTATQSSEQDKAAFTPTHKLADGTKVSLQQNDDDTYFVDEKGDEWDYTDTAEPITNEKENNTPSDVERGANGLLENEPNEATQTPTTQVDSQTGIDNQTAASMENAPESQTPESTAALQSSDDSTQIPLKVPAPLSVQQDANSDEVSPESSVAPAPVTTTNAAGKPFSSEKMAQNFIASSTNKDYSPETHEAKTVDGVVGIYQKPAQTESNVQAAKNDNLMPMTDMSKNQENSSPKTEKEFIATHEKMIAHKAEVKKLNGNIMSLNRQIDQSADPQSNPKNKDLNAARQQLALLNRYKPTLESQLKDEFKARSSNANVPESNFGNIEQSAENAQSNDSEIPDSSTKLPIKTAGRIELLTDLANIAVSRKGINKAFSEIKVSPEVAQKVKEKTGVDVTGWVHGIDEDSVRHIFKQHGNEATEKARGQIAVTAQDIASIKEIVENPDEVSKGKDINGIETVIFKKTIGDMAIYVQEIRVGKQKLAAKTLWKIPVAPTATADNAGELHTPETFNAHNSQGSDNVPKTTDIYNRSNRSNEPEDEQKSALVAKAGVTGTQIQKVKQDKNLSTFSQNPDIKALGFDAQKLKEAEHLIEQIAETALNRKQSELNEQALAHDLEKLAQDPKNGITVEQLANGATKYTMTVDGKKLSFTRSSNSKNYSSDEREKIDQIERKLVEIGAGEWNVKELVLAVQPFDKDVAGMRERARNNADKARTAEAKMQAAAEAKKSQNFFNDVFKKLKDVFYSLFKSIASNPDKAKQIDDTKQYKWRNADNTAFFEVKKGSGTFVPFDDNINIKGKTLSEKKRNIELKNQLNDEMKSIQATAFKRGLIAARAAGGNTKEEINNEVEIQLSAYPELLQLFEPLKAAPFDRTNFKGFTAARGDDYTPPSNQSEPAPNNPQSPETEPRLKREKAYKNAFGEIEALKKLSGGFAKESELEAARTRHAEVRSILQNKDKPKEEEVKPSKTQSNANAYTKESLSSELKRVADEVFGKGWFSRLLATDKFKIIDSNEAKAFTKEKGVQAFYHNGTTYFVADGIAAKTDLVGLLKHEIGVHALKMGKDDAGFQSILKQIESMRGKNAAIDKAFAAAERAGTSKADLLEEVAGYLVEQAPELKLTQRLLAWFRNAIRKLTGDMFANNLTVNDLNYMAREALRKAPDELILDAVEPQGMNLSKASDIFKPIAEQVMQFKKELIDLMLTKKTLVAPITVSDTSFVLKAVGATELPIMISRDVIRKATNGIKHNVSMGVIESLPEMLADPAMVLNSITESDSLIVLSDRKDESNRSVMIALRLSVKDGRAVINRISSVYGRNDEYFTNLVKNGHARYINMNKSRDWLRPIESTMFQGGTSKKGSYGNYITEKDLINSETVKFSKTQPEESQFADDYELNRQNVKSKKQHLKDMSARFGKEAAHGIGNFLGSARTRLENISPKLGAKYIQLEHDIAANEAKAVKAVKPFMDKTKTMSKSDVIDFDFAAKNNDSAKIDELVSKYNMQAEYQAMLDALEKVNENAKEVGMAVNDGIPKVLRDTNGFLDAIGEGVFTKRLKEYAADMGLSYDELTLEQKADIVNGMIKTGSRSIKKDIGGVTPELNQYFMGTNAAILSHIHEMTKHAQYRKFLGGISKKVRTTQKELEAIQADIAKQENLMTNAKTDDAKESARQKLGELKGVEGQLNAILLKYALQNDYHENVASYIMKAIADGEIKPSDERIVQEVLNARLHEKGATGVTAAYKNLSLIDTMGSVVSAITQIGDFTWALYESGNLFRGLKAINNARRKNVVFDKTDFGLERIAQEFTESDTFAGAVGTVFKYVGIKYVTGVASDSLLNAISDKLTRQAQANDSRLMDKLKTYFDDDANQVLEDLKNGVINDNTRLMIYSRYLDFAPVAMSELPIKYQTAGNGRVMYMLKTYTLKLFDIYRREAVKEIFSGDKQRAIQGMKNLTMILALLMLTGAGGDELKDYLLGRNTDFDDRVTDNLWKLAGLSKFITWQVRREGLGTAAFKQIMPPFAFINALGEDISTATDIKRHPKNELWVNGLDVTNSIPVVGKIYYWQIGRGTQKRKELSEIRFKKEKQKLDDIKDELEQLEGDEKKQFYSEHKADLWRLKQAGRVQASANRLKEIINKQRAMPKSDEREAIIDNLESKRDAVISRFVGMD